MILEACYLSFTEDPKVFGQLVVGLSCAALSRDLLETKAHTEGAAECDANNLAAQ